MNKQALKQQSDEALMRFLLSGGKIEVVKPKKNPKRLTAGSGSTKHCGRSNKFGQRI